MKSAQINSYGETDVMEINPNSPKPTLKPGQILIENYAASINPIDWKVRKGFLQKMVPLQFPVTLGGDFAGKVIEVSIDVTDFKVGDGVYGHASVLGGGSGSIAEFVAANTSGVAHKPKSTNLEESGALPLAGISALQALEENIKLQNGQKILIHGGAGGIGHFAIQIAKSIGAHVATTVKSDDFEFVKSLDADEVIDYKSQKFEESLKDYDAVFDNVGGETTDKSFQVLKKGGIIVSMLAQPNQELAQKYEVTAIVQGTQVNTQRLNRLSELVDGGKIKVNIDKVFPLDKSAEAFTYQENIHPRGKVVIKIR